MSLLATVMNAMELKSEIISYRFIHPVDKNDIGAQVRMAAQCCKLTDTMISQCDNLWTVPQRLIEQARQMNPKTGHGKRQSAAAARKIRVTPTNMPKTTNNGVDKIRINSNHVHKIIL